MTTPQVVHTTLPFPDRCQQSVFISNCRRIISVGLEYPLISINYSLRDVEFLLSRRVSRWRHGRKTCLYLPGRGDRFQTDQPVAELQFRQQVARARVSAAGSSWTRARSARAPRRECPRLRPAVAGRRSPRRGRGSARRAAGIRGASDARACCPTRHPGLAGRRDLARVEPFLFQRHADRAASRGSSRRAR